MLYVLRGPDKGGTFETSGTKALIGRKSEIQSTMQSTLITLTDDSVSRRHALLRQENDSSEEGTWTLEDLNSSNGTYLNGRRIYGRTRLQHGDQIKLGASILVFSGEKSVVHVSGPGRIRDLVDLDVGCQTGDFVEGDFVEGDAAILSSIAASEDSVILQPPETADQVAAWNVMYKIAEAIGTVPLVEDFLERITDIVFDHLVVDRLVILMLDRDFIKGDFIKGDFVKGDFVKGDFVKGDFVKGKSGKLTPQVVRYRTAKKNKRPKIHTSRTIINHVLKTKEGILCANAMTDLRFTGQNKQDSIHQIGLRSVLCVPIIAHNLVQGVIHLDCSMSHHTYTAEHLRLATAIGRMAGMAIENARLLESRMRHERLAATGETVASLSHEIRNILQGLRSGADVVEIGLKKKQLDVVASGWKIAKRGMNRTVVLATNMLAFSKARQPRIELVQVNQVTAEAAKSVQTRADDKGVMILSEFDDRMPAIEVDPNGLRQALCNILLNAVDAVSPTTGRVNVNTHYDPQSQRAVIAIADNGPGIEKEKLHLIFQPLYSSKGQAGTGLGLAVAKKVIHELAGKIEVQSSPTQGATFRVILPVQQHETADSEKTHGPGKE